MPLSGINQNFEKVKEQEEDAGYASGFWEWKVTSNLL